MFDDEEDELLYDEDDEINDVLFLSCDAEEAWEWATDDEIFLA